MRTAFANTRRHSLPLAHPAQSAAEPARVPVTFRPGHRDAGLSLYQLQDAFDGEAAHLAVRRLRIPARPCPPLDLRSEARWLAVALPLAALALTLAAAVLP